MGAARGDCKPCTRRDCSGTMQFGRQPPMSQPSASTSGGERGWVCSESPGHFQHASDGARPTAADTSSHARWATDGGSTASDAHIPLLERAPQDRHRGVAS